MKDFIIELTTHSKIKEVNNEKCHNYYYVQHGRIYNANHTRFRRFKFILWFDIYDVQDFFEEDLVTIHDIVRYATECGINYCDNHQHLIQSFNECDDFYVWCNETINHYNGC